MKKSLLTLPVLFALANNLIAQVDGNYENSTKSEGNYQYNSSAPAAGNYQYNTSAANYNYQYSNQQTAQTMGRDPATATYPSADEINIGINGIVNVEADNYVAVFNILQVGPTARIADSLMNYRIGQLKVGLKRIGVDTSDIKLDMISFVPKYDFKRDNAIFSRRYNEVPVGFELEKNVYVHFKHTKSLDAILSMAAESEIYDLVKVDYFIPNTQRLVDSLRFRCLEELKSRIKSYQIVGFKLDTLRKTMADGFKTIYPETKYASYQAVSRPSIGAVKKRADDQPFAPQISIPYSRFYNQVNYDNYDIVINPLITEPVVQISYTINVKYFLKAEEKPKSYYYVIAANGDVKQINIK